MPDRESAPLRGMPYPENGDQKTSFGICPNPCLAQDLVAGLEGPSDQSMHPQRQGTCLSLKTTRFEIREITVSRPVYLVSAGICKRKRWRDKTMKGSNRKLEQTWSGVGWGLFLILVGGLFLAGNKGWLDQGSVWSYFAIGLGTILVIGFFVRYFGILANRWSGVVDLIAGLALVLIGIASLYGFGDWWPLVLLAIGIGILVKGIVNRKRVLANGETYPETKS
jgi:hypothetical protein